MPTSRDDHDRVPDPGAAPVPPRDDLRAARRSGAPPLGHLVGLRRRPMQETSCYALELDPSRPALTGGPGVLELAMTADLALGGAIRDRFGLALPMPTVAMTIQLTGRPLREVRWADGECTGRTQRTAGARSRLFSQSGSVVADAVGVFALPKLPYEGSGRSMPWDRPFDEPDAVDGEGPAEPDDRGAVWIEQAQVGESIEAHAAGSPEIAWATHHLAERLSSRVDHHELAPSPVMANRLGHVQGGVLFTAAVLAAARQGGFSVESLSTGAIEFITAAELGSPLLPRVRVLRAGGRSLFATVVLEQEDDVCGHVSLVFRR